MSITDAILLAVAAFAAGAINAVAGGGTLVSFPALVAAGYATKVANVTNTVAILPGYLGGSLAYRGELKRQPENILAVLGPTLLGALIGSVVLLSTPEKVFQQVVPFLILAACALLAIQNRLGAIFSRGVDVKQSIQTRLPLLFGILLASIYGAYFGAGLGIIVLATLGLFLEEDIQKMNALKGIISLLINGFAAVYFMVFAHVAWEAAAVMAVAALAGGYLGVGVARRLKRDNLKRFVIAYGTIAAIVIFIRG